jgi:hypothetical protein
MHFGVLTKRGDVLLIKSPEIAFVIRELKQGDRKYRNHQLCCSG